MVLDLVVLVFPRDNRAFASYASKVGVSHNIGEVTDSFNEDHASFLKKYFINKKKKSYHSYLSI